MIDLSNATAVSESLGISAPPETWAKTWDKSAATFKPDAIPFLQPECVADFCTWLGIDQEVEQALLDELKHFENNLPLQRLAWHIHSLLFVENTDSGGWPELGSGLTWALVLLSGLPWVRECHQKLGVSKTITLETLSDLQLWVNESKNAYGSFGLKEAGWLTSHFTGKLFTLGRLQFLPGKFHHPFRVYRHADNRVTILAEAGCLFRTDGQFADADKGVNKDAEGNWTATLEITDDTITGYPVDSKGFVKTKPVTLSTDQWHEILRQEDEVLTVHIPATGSMKPVDCGNSFKQANSFFQKHFPEEAYKAFTCHSWLLDPQLGLHLPAESNIVNFLNAWLLYPHPKADDGQTIERVFGFGIEEIDLATAPQNSSLQKAVVKHMQQGNLWRSGAGLIFAEDLGRTVYC